MLSGNSHRIGASTPLVIALGATLNQSSILGGFNLSLADMVVVILLVGLAYRRQLHVPSGPLTVFLLFSTVITFNAAFIVPALTSVDVSLTTVLGGYIKLWASFLFFVVGMQLARMGELWAFARSFYFTACAVSSIGALYLVGIHVPLTQEMVLFGFRFVGLMNDPNYYSVLTVAALAIMYRDKDISSRLKPILSMVLVAGVLSSASKTGLVALLLWVIWILTVSIRRDLRERPAALVSKVVATATLAGLIVLLLEDSSGDWFANTENPALQRIAPIFTDFDSATSDGGSSRGEAWGNALVVTGRLPILGTGPGAYSPVAQHLVGSAVIAHNTFLQLLAEWGIPLSMIFWIIVTITLTRASSGTPRSVTLALRDASLVLLVGSIGISLNNARLFWVLLGALFFTISSNARLPNQHEFPGGESFSRVPIGFERSTH